MLACISETAPRQLMGADYAAVLTACAAHLWLQPHFLHRLVCQIETGMAKLEADTAAEEIP